MSSKLINCKACGKEIAKGCKKCPNCGKDQRSFFGKHKILTVFLILVVLGIVVAATGGSKNKDAKPTTKSEVQKDEPKKEDSKITYDNFLKINMGQSYDEIKAILGDGKELSSSEINGIKTVMYTWNGKGISNMNVSIQNNAVTTKAQVGLADNNSNITLEKYNQVKEGMTYDEVKAILGEGQITSQTKIANIESIMYSYINKGGSNANFTFNQGKLQLKAQFNLK